MRPDLGMMLETIRVALAEPGAARTVVLPDGTNAELVRDPGPGVRARVTPTGAGAESLTITVYDAAPARPPAFPPDLPFVADRELVVAVTGRDGILASWWDVPDPEMLVAALERESLRSGWHAAAGPPCGPAAAGLRAVRFERAGRTRTIVGIGSPETGFVNLVDESAER